MGSPCSNGVRGATRCSIWADMVCRLSPINQPTRSLIDAARSPYAFSVAAVDVDTFQQEVYSSEGPTHGPGGALTGGNLKPNISGFANVNTWAYGNFNGTSAATPHVAGAAALSVLTPVPTPTTSGRTLLPILSTEGRRVETINTGAAYCG